MPISVTGSSTLSAPTAMRDTVKFGEDRRTAQLMQQREANDLQKIADDNAISREIESEMGQQFNAQQPQQASQISSSYLPQQKPEVGSVQGQQQYAVGSEQQPNGISAGQIADASAQISQPVSIDQLKAPIQQTTRPSPPELTTQEQGGQQELRTTPFDSPDFTSRIAQRIAGMRGSSKILMDMKAQRDSMLTKIMEMIGNGATDEAKWVANKNGFQIPEQFYKNSDIAAGMSFANKAYPTEPDKGYQFFQAFTQASNVPLDQRIQTALQAAGAPTNASSRQLSNAISLYKAQQDMKQNEPQPYVGQGGALNFVTPSTMTAQPVMGQNGQPFVPTAGKGVSTGVSDKRFMNVNGNLVDLQRVDANGNPTVVVPKGSDSNAAKLQIFKSIMSSPTFEGTEADAASRAGEIVGQFSQQGGAAQPTQAAAPVQAYQSPDSRGIALNGAAPPDYSNLWK